MTLSRTYATGIEAAADMPLKGIVFLVTGVTIFSIQDVIIKSLSDAYPAQEIVFVRCLVALVPLLVILRVETGGWTPRTRRPLLLLLRGLAGFLAYTTYYLALSVLSLADTVTLFYSSPLFVTALALPLLGERVGWRRWLAVTAGFLGVVVVMRPGGQAIDPAMILAVLAAVSYAVMVLITRRLGKAEASSTMSVYSMFAFIAASALFGLALGDGAYDRAAHGSAQFLLRAWVLPSWPDFGLLVFCGLIASIGFYCLTQAYRIASPSLIAPFEYASLPWAVFWGYLFWSELPGANTLIGILLVVLSGLYIIRRETVRGRRVVVGRPLR
jgi:S-adenosylmethionine uptake transporter